MADFNEVAEQLRIFSEKLKDTLEVELTQEHFKFAQNLTQQAVSRVEAQKEFADSLKEEELINRQIDLFKRKQATQDVKKLATTIQEKTALDQQISGIDKLLNENAMLLKAVDEQVASWGRASGLAEELNLNQRRHLQIAIEVAAILKGQTDLTGQQLEDRLQQLRVEDSHVNLLEKATREIRHQKILNKSLLGDIKVLGRSFSEMREDFTDLLSTPGGLIKATLTAALIVIMKINQVMQELLDTGLSVRQTFDAIGQTVKVMATGGIDNLLAWKDTFRAVSGLRSQFGDLKFQTDAMVENTQDLVTFFRLTGQEAAKITEILTKVGGLSAQQQDDFQKSARAFAKINDLNPASVMRAVAQHARQFALAGAAGADEFIRASFAADRMGVALEKIEGIRDNVLDIDKLFTGVAELRTLGIDIPDPAVLAQAAQFEGPQGFVRELQRQLKATGRELSREGLGGTVQVGMLERLFGVDLAEMNRILNQGAEKSVEATEAQVASQKDVSEQLVTGLATLTSSLNKTTIALIAFAAFIGPSAILTAGRTLLGRVAAGAGSGVGAGAGAGITGFQTTAAAAGIGGAGVGGRAMGAFRAAGPALGKAARVGGIAGGAIAAGIGAFGDVKDIAGGAARGEDARARGIGGLTGTVAGGTLGAVLGGMATFGFGTAIGASLGAALGGFVGRGVGDLIGNLFEDAPVTEKTEAQRAIAGEIPPSAVSDAALQLAAAQQAKSELDVLKLLKGPGDEKTVAFRQEVLNMLRGGVIIKINPDGVGKAIVREYGHSVG